MKVLRNAMILFERSVLAQLVMAAPEAKSWASQLPFADHAGEGLL